ncbi:uncharacterized protein LOC126470383 [Schistocerca serialis cubense]|uniref:uncharacterized protein LOC126470383 n=1 Tax=Schistocerca serialis cubense TaxID=2023355 RepID=UPI00214F0833|nr:uncharacterized protein LOC126470383 [Schistocerca serialis cubense]
MPGYDPTTEDYTDIDGEEMIEDDESRSSSTVLSHAELYADDSAYMHGGGLPLICPLNAVVEYGPMPYVADPVVPAAHVIEKPPEKTSLHAEIDSFYSDLASLEQTAVTASSEKHQIGEHTGAASETEKESMIAPATIELSSSANSNVGGLTGSTAYQKVSAHIEGKTSEAPIGEVRKKKKPKLAPGLSLKKKDVSSLVAKWQKLQEEVRRDYKKLGDELKDK